MISHLLSLRVMQQYINYIQTIIQVIAQQIVYNLTYPRTKPKATSAKIKGWLHKKSDRNDKRKFFNIKQK